MGCMYGFQEKLIVLVILYIINKRTFPHLIKHDESKEIYLDFNFDFLNKKKNLKIGDTYVINNHVSFEYLSHQSLYEFRGLVAWQQW